MKQARKTAHPFWHAEFYPVAGLLVAWNRRELRSESTHWLSANQRMCQQPVGRGDNKHENDHSQSNGSHCMWTIYKTTTKKWQECQLIQSRSSRRTLSDTQKRKENPPKQVAWYSFEVICVTEWVTNWQPSTGISSEHNWVQNIFDDQVNALPWTRRWCWPWGCAESSAESAIAPLDWSVHRGKVWHRNNLTRVSLSEHLRW